MKRELTFYAAFFFASMIFMRLSGVIAKIILARSITPYEYGIVTLVVISLPVFFQLFANLSFYDVLSHSKRGRKYFGFSIIFTLIVMSFISVLIFIFHEAIFNFLNLPLDSWEVIYFSILLTAFPVVTLTDFMGLYAGLRKYSIATKISLLPSVLRLIFIAIAVYIFNITDFFSIMLIFSIPSFFAFAFYLIREFKTIKSHIKSIELPSKDIMAFGFSLFIVNTFLSSNYVIIKIVISHLLGVEMQGYFDVSMTLVSVLTFFSATLHFLIVPETTSSKGGKNIFSRNGGLGDVTKLLFSYLLFCVVIIHFYSTDLVKLLFSESYLMAAEYTSIIAFGFVFLFLQRFVAYFNISKNEKMKEHKPLVTITLIFLVILPIFTYIMIYLMGFSGAYFSTAILSILYAIATFSVSKCKTELLYIFNGAEKILLSLVAIILFIIVTKVAVFFGIIFSAILYTILLFATGYLNRRIITDFFKK